MARGSRISIYGLYTYDPTLFDGLSLPDQLDAETFVDNLIMDCSDMEVLYPDAEFMKGTTTGKVSAWNDTGFSDRNQDSSTSSQSGQVTTTETFHVEGDSAITDAQDVLKKEMDVRIKYDLYNIILNEFKRHFCLLVY